jgi:hypothetical protein
MLFAPIIHRQPVVGLGDEPLSADAQLIKATMDKMVLVENDLTLWFNDILVAVSLGVARCDLVQKYKQAAIAAYEEMNIVLAIISGLAPGIPQAAPVPGLFAKSARIAAPTATTNRTIILVDPDCLPSGAINTSSLKIIPKGTCPTCPTPVGEAQTTAAGQLGFAAVAACLGAPVACGIIAAIVLAGGYLIIDKVGAHLSGAENQRLQAFVISQAVAAERARADIYNKCTTDAIKALAPGSVTPAILDKIQTRCGDLVAKINVDDLVKQTTQPGLGGSIVEIIKWVAIAGFVAALAPPAIRWVGDSLARRRDARER